MADASVAFQRVCEIFKIESLNPYQREAIVYLVERKKDVFVNLPTGFGKSLIYQALPLVFDVTRNITGHIVLVVSPLVNLMKDQVENLQKLGIPAISLSEVKEGEASALEEGKFRVVYGTPEAWLKIERWRKMLSSEIYASKVCAIAVDEAHVIKQWGTSNNSSMVAFREAYSELHEFRSLVPAVKMIALTATATSVTRKTIMDVLLMNSPHVIFQSPSKPNIAYSVYYIPKDRPLEEYFEWLGDELMTERTNTTRTIIYCQTIKQCGSIYSTLKAMIGSNIFFNDTNNQRNVILEMLHSCTPEANKNAILEAFRDENSGLRILVATIAFGMGVDCKGVYRTIHFGPSKNVEAYIQETGRAGRDGKQSVAYLLYQGILLSHVDKDMKHYVMTEDCRRKTLLSNFDSTSAVEYPQPMHLCCDNCAVKCNCGSSACELSTQFPGSDVPEDKSDFSVRKRLVTQDQKNILHKFLTDFQKSLVENLKKQPNNQVKSLTNPQFLLGFTEVQIAQVLDNCENLFTVQDVLDRVEMWNLKHAHKIVGMMSQVFGDICEIDECTFEGDTSFTELEQSLFGDWDALMQDDSLFELAMDNLSLSQLETSVDVSHEQSGNFELPISVLDVLQNYSVPSE